jgi:hemoglobin
MMSKQCRDGMSPSLGKNAKLITRLSVAIVVPFLAIGAIVAMPHAALAETGPDSVYQAMGGRGGIKAIVDDFLQLVLADTRIKKTFQDADLEHLAMRLNEQFCELGGGPCKYGGKDMKTIHADLHITNAQFNALAEDLQLAMDKHGVPSREQNKLLAKLAPMQHSIVTQ